MSFFKKIFGGNFHPDRGSPAPQPSQAQSSQAPRPSAARSQTANGPGPKASRIYIFSSKVINSEDRQEALWGGFFARHKTIDRSVAEYVQIAGCITYVSPEWKKGETNLEHAANLSDKVLDGLFDDEHKGGCYLDAIVLFPDKPTVFVVLVWNASVASDAMRNIPGAQMGKVSSQLGQKIVDLSGRA